MTQSFFQMQVSMEGLMELLGKHLYSTPDIVIRELIQNACDSITRRQLEGKKSFFPKIHVKTESKNQKLLIEDNGAGLTKQEIQDYLATIGSGYTRLLRNQESNPDLIGYFGLGFLSTYVVSDLVEVYTLSCQENAEGLCFQSNGASRYNIKPIPRQEVGSQIRLSLSKKFSRFSEEDKIINILQTYCSLLPFPIYFNNDPTPINITPPWREKAVSPFLKRKKYWEFAENKESYPPLCAFPLESEKLSMKGILWIHNTITYGNADSCSMEVYIRGMLITPNEKELLPSWARFVGGMLETNDLLPTASREELRKNVAFFQIQEAIAQTLVAALSHYAQKETSTWKRILNCHNEALIEATLSDESLFQVLAKDIKVPTHDGEKSLPLILKKSRGKIYISMQEQQNPETLIFLQSQSIPVVKGYRCGAYSFCQQYTENIAGGIVRLGTEEGSHSFFQQEPLSAEVHERLKSLLIQEGGKLIPCRFDPSFLPLVKMVNDEDIRLRRRRMVEDRSDRKISAGALSLASHFTQQIKKEKEYLFYLNLDSPLVQKWIVMEGEKQKTMARILRSFTQIVLPDWEEEDSDAFRNFYETFSENLLKLME